MLPFDCNKASTRERGKIAKAFWHKPHVLRSQHPEVSFSARGKMASVIVEKHPKWYTNGATIIENQHCTWKDYAEISYDESDFLDIGQTYENHI